MCLACMRLFACLLQHTGLCLPFLCPQNFGASPCCCCCRGSFWEDMELGKWVSAVRTAKRWNVLSVAELDALDTLGFTYAMDKARATRSWATLGWGLQ